MLSAAADTPVTEIDMHVRIDRFTSVRVIAEKADGGLEMRSAWVKASGGCSAPASAAAGGTLGEIRLQTASDSKSVAGASCALALGTSFDVTLIDPDEPYVTCPMSNAVIVGLRELPSITVPREGLRRRSVRVVGDRVTAIDTRRRPHPPMLRRNTAPAPSLRRSAAAIPGNRRCKACATACWRAIGRWRSLRALN